MLSAKHMARVCAWVIGLVLLAASAAAQESTRVGGIVRDQAGSPVADAIVTLSSARLGVTHRSVTGADGRFTFSAVTPSVDYRLSAVHAGFQSLERPLPVVPGESREHDVTLMLTATEHVTVAAPPAEGMDATPRQQIDEELAREVPLIDRGFMHLASLAPGFGGRPDFPDAQGQYYWNTGVMVDGASDFSKWRGAARSFYSGYSRETISEVTVASALFPPALGSALASVVTASTRAGGDTWHGSAFVFGRHSALAAPPVFATREPTGATTQYGSSIGGPLQPRTFLFASYDARRAREHNVVSSPAAEGETVPTNLDERLAFVRVDHRVSDRQSLTARLNMQFLRWHDEPGALTLPGNGTAFTNNAHTALVTHALQRSSATSNELRVQFSRYQDVRRDLNPAVYVSRTGYSIEGGLLGPEGMGVDPEDTWEAHEVLRHEAGQHALRAGGTIAVVSSHAFNHPFASGAYFFAGAPDAAPAPYLYYQGVVTSTDATRVDSRSVSGAAFAQDDWRFGAVTLTVGLRYDVEQITGVRNFGPEADVDNLQPRAGLTWAVGPHGTTVRAAAGIYTQQQVLYPIHQVALQGAGGVAVVVVAPESPAFPPYPLVLPPDVALQAAAHDVYRVTPDFRNPYSRQAGGGIEQALQHFTVSADYLHLTGHDLVSVIDVNAPASVTKPADRTVAEADATRSLSPASGYRKVLTIGNAGRSWYNALQVKVTGGPASLHLVGSYTYARAEDQANYLLPEDSNNLAAERARASTDVRHSGTAAMTWQVPGQRPLTRGWHVGSVATLRTGRPYTIAWGDDRNGTTQNDARPGGRNTAEGGAYRVIDVSVAKRGRVGGASLEARLEVFNLFNTVNYDEYVGALLSPMYGQPISAFPRRRGQLALTMRF